MTEFTPLASTAGGMLIGLSAVFLMLYFGRIAGISGILVRVFPPFQDKESFGRLAFILGLIAAPFIYKFLSGHGTTITMNSNILLMLIAGFLVGFGAVWGNGCTSGHGICGLARFSKRSIVAVAVFMLTAIITVYVTRHVL